MFMLMPHAAGPVPTLYNLIEEVRCSKPSAEALGWAYVKGLLNLAVQDKLGDKQKIDSLFGYHAVWFTRSLMLPGGSMHTVTNAKMSPASLNCFGIGISYSTDFPVRAGSGFPAEATGASLTFTEKMVCLPFAEVNDLLKGKFPRASVGSSPRDTAYMVNEKSDRITIVQLSPSLDEPACLHRYSVATNLL